MTVAPDLLNLLKDFAGHAEGVVISQPERGKFEERPMTRAELAARAPAIKIAKDIYRLADQAGVCYYEIWRLIVEAMDALSAPEPAAPKSPSGAGELSNVTAEDVRVFVESCKSLGTPWALGVGSLLVSLWDDRERLLNASHASGSDLERAAKVCKDMVQDLIECHMSLDRETGAAVWDDDSYEAQAMALTEAAAAIRQLQEG